MKPLIVDNFLDKQSFQNLQNVMFGNEFYWFFNDGIDYPGEEGNKFQFTHNFYKENIGVNSNQYGILSNILNKIQPKEIFRIKANLLTKTPEIVPNSFHTDIQGNWGVIPYTTSIFYLNTNNGYTEFEDGTIVESVENRWISFPIETKHRGTSCTDEKIRVVINFNYLT